MSDTSIAMLWELCDENRVVARNHEVKNVFRDSKEESAFQQSLLSESGSGMIISFPRHYQRV